MSGNARATVRLVGAGIAVVVLVTAAPGSISSAESAGRAVSLTKLCARLIPTKSALPASLRTVGMSAFTLTLSAEAQAHHALCSVGLSSPSNGYRDNVGWDVFPTHALAAADFTSYPVSLLYDAITVDRPANGFPFPNFAVVGAGKRTGKPVSVIAFVDGPTIVSAYIYGAGNNLAAVRPIARWALADIKAIEHPRATHHAVK